MSVERISLNDPEVSLVSNQEISSGSVRQEIAMYRDRLSKQFDVVMDELSVSESRLAFLRDTQKSLARALDALDQFLGAEQDVSG